MSLKRILIYVMVFCLAIHPLLMHILYSLSCSSTSPSYTKLQQSIQVHDSMFQNYNYMKLFQSVLNTQFKFQKHTHCQ